MPLNHGAVHRERVGAAAAGRTLLGWLAEAWPGAGEPEWRARIERGLVKLDGAPGQPEQVLLRGQELRWERPPWEEPEVPLCAAVLHEDAELLAVAKPRGLPTLPGGGEFLEHTLLAVVRRRAPEASPMHRLGRGTSGVVLFARTLAARRAVQEAFRARTVRKVYRALCAGAPAWDALQIDAPIGEVPHPPLGVLFAAREDGKPSRSRARVLERRAEVALLEVEIETGRPHQIRIHLAWAGHPLAGDPLYGKGGLPLPGAKPGDLGYWLHAEHLELPHPRTGEPLVIRCAPPPVLKERAREQP